MLLLWNSMFTDTGRGKLGKLHFRDLLKHHATKRLDRDSTTVEMIWHVFSGLGWVSIIYPSLYMLKQYHSHLILLQCPFIHLNICIHIWYFASGIYCFSFFGNFGLNLWERGGKSDRSETVTLLGSWNMKGTGWACKMAKLSWFIIGFTTVYGRYTYRWL